MDQNLSGRGDLLLGDHGSGHVELVVAGTLEEIGVGAMGLVVGVVWSTSAAQKPTCSYG